MDKKNNKVEFIPGKDFGTFKSKDYVEVYRTPKTDKDAERMAKQGYKVSMKSVESKTKKKINSEKTSGFLKHTIKGKQ